MDNVSKEMEILRENQGKVLEIKTAVTKKKNAFNGPARERALYSCGWKLGKAWKK